MELNFETDIVVTTNVAWNKSSVLLAVCERTL